MFNEKRVMFASKGNNVLKSEELFLIFSIEGFQTISSCMEGFQLSFKFPNGYGASIVRHIMSYGGMDGLWELAVIGRDDKL